MNSLSFIDEDGQETEFLLLFRPWEIGCINLPNQYLSPLWNIFANQIQITFTNCTRCAEGKKRERSQIWINKRNRIVLIQKSLRGKQPFYSGGRMRKWMGTEDKILTDLLPLGRVFHRRSNHILQWVALPISSYSTKNNYCFSRILVLSKIKRAVSCRRNKQRLFHCPINWWGEQVCVTENHLTLMTIPQYLFLPYSNKKT